MDATGLGVEERFQELATEWIRIGDVISREDTFTVLQSEATAIRRRGRWVSGPPDLLTIVGRHDDELFHSRIVGWLSSPSGRHGLGSKFHDGLFRAVWGDEIAPVDGPVEIELEVERVALNALTRVGVQARADLVIRRVDVTVVIENKVNAGE
jgi:PD-(D/E)XK nuclease superfamily